MTATRDAGTDSGATRRATPTSKSTATEPTFTSGQFVATSWDIPLNNPAAQTWSRITGIKKLPLGTIGLIVGQPRAGRLRYLVTFIAEPVLTLRMRAIDLHPIEVDLMIRHELGGKRELGFVNWGSRARLAYLPEQLPSRPARLDLPQPSIEEFARGRRANTHRKAARLQG